MFRFLLVLFNHPLRLFWQKVTEFDEQVIDIVRMLRYLLYHLVKEGLIRNENATRGLARLIALLLKQPDVMCQRLEPFSWLAKLGFLWVDPADLIERFDLEVSLKLHR